MKKFQPFFLILLSFSLLTLHSCKKNQVTSGFETSPKKEGNLNEIKTAVTAMNEKFAIAWNTSNAGMIADCYTSDAKLLIPNGENITGRENIKNHFKAVLEANPSTMLIRTLDNWGNEEFMASEIEWTLSDKEGNIIDSGKAIELFKKEDGKWKMYRDIYSSNNK